MPLYPGQPVFGDIDLELRSQGFIPHMFPALNKRMILPLHFSDNIYAAMNQLLEADIVYVRDFRHAGQDGHRAAQAPRAGRAPLLPVRTIWRPTASRTSPRGAPARRTRSAGISPISRGRSRPERRRRCQPGRSKPALFQISRVSGAVSAAMKSPAASLAALAVITAAQ